MSNLSKTDYLLSRLNLAFRSPGKAAQYVGIVLRIPLLWLYYKAYDLRFGETASLHRARQEPVQSYSKGDPLISVVIATYNRADLLVERSLKSVLAQTYQNFEVIVVGDGCTDHTAEAIATLHDPRIHYFNLNERGKYPQNPKHCWFVAGTLPVNYGNKQAKGLWIAHLDDDEIFTPEHLEKLLRAAQNGNYEFVYSKVRQEQQPGVWVNVGKTPMIKYLYMNYCGHSTTLWRNYLNCFNYDINSWRINVPGDFNRWSRLLLAGVRIGFLPEVTAIAPLRPGVTLFGHLSEDRY